MTDRLVWIFLFFSLYGVYSVYWGAASGRIARTSDDFFLAARQIPGWVFAIVVTVASFTGWAVIGLPALVFRDGFPAASLALGAITISLTGVLFMKRQWMLSRRFGYVTPAEMYADYFGGRLIRLIVLGIALLFALPFLGMQLTAAGYLVEIVSNATIPWVFASWVLAGLVFLYTCLGGMRAAAYVGTLQGLLFAAVLVSIGVFVWVAVGGFSNFVALLAKLGASKLGPWGASAAGYNAYFETPGVVQFVAGIGREAPVGGLWTVSLVFSYCISLMSLQLAPAVTICAFSASDVRGFAAQQVWTAAAGIGLILVFFAVLVGAGALFLGGSVPITVAGLAVGHQLPALGGGDQVALVAYYIKAIGDRSPWFMGLLATAAVAAAQATAALYASGTGTIFARDFYRHYLHPTADDRQLKVSGRIGLGLALLAALLLATFAPRAQAEFGVLTLACGVQLLPAAAATCWLPWLTRRAVISGLFAGVVVAVFTDKLGATLVNFIGVEMPWGRWPWMIHPAGWGLACNVVVCLVGSPLTRNQTDRERRAAFHAFLVETGGATPVSRVLRICAWLGVLAWFFFAIGPGLIIGTDLFGAPNVGPAAWLFGIPSLWAWQIIWWMLGVLLLWLLAYKLQMSTSLRDRIEPVVDSIRRLTQSPRIVTDPPTAQECFRPHGIEIPLRIGN